MEGLIREKLNWQRAFQAKRSEKNIQHRQNGPRQTQNKMVLLKRNVKEHLKVRAGKKVV